MNIVTHNVKGCSGKQSCKLDHISNMINRQESPNVYLIQATWILEDEITLIDDVIFISHGYDKEPNEICAKNGGVSMVLSKAAQKS